MGDPFAIVGVFFLSFCSDIYNYSDHIKQGFVYPLGGVHPTFEDTLVAIHCQHTPLAESPRVIICITCTLFRISGVTFEV